MRRKLIAGNWKMNLNVKDSEKLAREITEKTDNKFLKDTDVLICPAFISIDAVGKIINNSGIKLGAQNLFYENDGAYTGEISASMLISAGCEYVIIGHSERRTHIHETNQILNKKILKSLEAGLKPVLCVGETLIEREDEIYEGIIDKQIREALAEVTEEQMKNVIIAYEPVWAIGTGLTATPEQASTMHGFIGKIVHNLYGEKTANELRILYGGSVNEKNSDEMLSACGVDGALVGGASLKADEFIKIIKSATSKKSKLK
jgi:triosephosphate isomerase